jgi:hypothetical protein
VCEDGCYKKTKRVEELGDLSNCIAACRAKVSNLENYVNKVDFLTSTKLEGCSRGCSTQFVKSDPCAGA